MNSTKIFEEMINCLIWKITMKFTAINLSKAICKNPTPRFKMKIRLVYTEGNVCKDTKNHELQI